ncbi:hypothetical protein SteCoe_11870 [Stentor coeruleus]|uniref:Uncharacterized protein n=1 Tax=Stentor coeruleus TaxID=5963 RepID=A0A1R2CC40_9CILI|nr:hypothetical protein SteCoe_11870 [Stentor coeruleus]
MVCCGNHGEESSTTGSGCWCDWGWYNSGTGEYCITSGDKNWGNAWTAFRVIFGIFYFLMCLRCTLKLYITLSKDKIKGVKRLFYRMFRSPRNLCLVFLVCIGILRVIWLSWDPFRFKEDADRITERVLHEFAYPFIYGLYSSVLLVWGGLYQGMKSKRTDPFKILRNLIMGMMVCAFPISIVISILKGNRGYSHVWLPISIAFLCSGIALMMVGFVVFGVFLFMFVEKSGEKKNHIPLRKSATDSGFFCDQEKTRKDIETRRSTSRKMSFVPRIKSLNIEIDENSWNNYNGYESKKHEPKMSEIIYYEETSTALKKKSETTEGYISMITHDDKMIFRKLCSLFFISSLLGVLVLIFIILMAKNMGESNSDIDIYILFIVFTIELFACAMIYLVFTAQIKVRDKNNLRFFSSISMKMNKKLPKIKYPTSFHNIGSRLHNFYS